ncbi:MAG TPA: hydrogenase maturation protease [Thermoanaerobaculia bacterium]|nr:hydrogenase maturation protease [Thermoanaerobaculia bacterium]
MAGVGNVFLGDDGFGVAVAERLRAPAGWADVDVVDFGIRGIDLAFALGEYDAAVLVDTVRQGGAPGTLYVLEPGEVPGSGGVAPHGMTPQRVLQWLPATGAPRLLRLVGCEPESFGEDGLGREGLSPPVAAAVEPAVRLVEDLVAELLTHA